MELQEYLEDTAILRDSAPPHFSLLRQYLDQSTQTGGRQELSPVHDLLTQGI